MPYDDQILLLPRSNYWDWLQACKEYVMTFGPNLTPDPRVAARYMAPRQVVTFPAFDGAYPEIGEPISWFHGHAPGVRLDPLDAGSPEALSEALQRRVSQNDRYGARNRSFHLLWPTDYAVVTQPFGVNPQIYRRYGMPGHEGVDFRALTNTNVYACADGQVYEVYTDPKSHAYGIHVRIQHEDGYKTVYAHLAKALVHKGDPVQAGQLIGRADSTGNSSAAHLHLSLKRDGATARQETTYPKDIIDPTPFLVWPAPKAAKARKSPERIPRLGLHLVRPDGWTLSDQGAALRSGAQAVMISHREPGATVESLRSARPGVRILARVGDALPGDGPRPARLVAEVAGEVGRLYRLGIRDFELGAYPNEYRGGFGRLWKDGAAFSEWLIGAVKRLREVFPEGRFGYPCLATGGDVIGRQQAAGTFFQASEAAVEEMNWIGVACRMDTDDAILQMCAKAHPDKPILITELSTDGMSVSPEQQAIQMSAFLRTVGEAGIEVVLCRLPAQDASGGEPCAWEALQIIADYANPPVGERPG